MQSLTILFVCNTENCFPTSFDDQINFGYTLAILHPVTPARWQIVAGKRKELMTSLRRFQSDPFGSDGRNLKDKNCMWSWFKMCQTMVVVAQFTCSQAASDWPVQGFTCFINIYDIQYIYICMYTRSVHVCCSSAPGLQHYLKWLTQATWAVPVRVPDRSCERQGCPTGNFYAVCDSI